MIPLERVVVVMESYTMIPPERVVVVMESYRMTSLEWVVVVMESYRVLMESYRVCTDGGAQGRISQSRLTLLHSNTYTCTHVHVYTHILI